MGARGVPWTSNADHQTRSKHNSIPAAFTAKFHLNRVFKDTFNLSKRRSQLKFRFGNFKLCMETTRTLCQSFMLVCCRRAKAVTYVDDLRGKMLVVKFKNNSAEGLVKYVSSDGEEAIVASRGYQVFWPWIQGFEGWLNFEDWGWLWLSVGLPISASKLSKFWGECHGQVLLKLKLVEEQNSQHDCESSTSYWWFFLWWRMIFSPDGTRSNRSVKNAGNPITRRWNGTFWSIGARFDVTTRQISWGAGRTSARGPRRRQSVVSAVCKGAVARQGHVFSL